MKKILIMGSDLYALLTLTQGNCLLAGERDRRQMMELEEM